MILYTVKYKKPYWPLWKTLKNVQADGNMQELFNRYFILEDNSRIEIPGDFMFKFSKERFHLITENQAKQKAEEDREPEDPKKKLAIVK